jgi:hypothetical protein
MKPNRLLKDRLTQFVKNLGVKPEPLVLDREGKIVMPTTVDVDSLRVDFVHQNIKALGLSL